jgi:hypothetical protein
VIRAADQDRENLELSNHGFKHDRIRPELLFAV